MKIALFDYVVAPHSGPGGCDAWVLDALGEEHEITVFASELVLPDGAARGVKHVPVRTVRHPALLSFLLYFARASVSYGLFRQRGVRFDVIQSTDCSFPAGEVFYAHLCHRAFLAEVWPEVRGHLTARKLHSWGNHKVRALVERRLVRGAQVIVVPSEGLRRDFIRMYPRAVGKVRVIPNTVDLVGFGRPEDFDRRSVRQQMDTAEGETAFVFVALGHFER
jgi:glycosyltransferase involved in cell wall biosynthesis